MHFGMPIPFLNKILLAALGANLSSKSIYGTVRRRLSLGLPKIRGLREMVASNQVKFKGAILRWHLIPIYTND